jgi:enterochelin esterase-like enzyme
MGAGQAMRTGLGNLDTFGFVGSFSGGSRDFDAETSYGGVFRDAATANRRIRLLWIGCGEKDFLFENNSKMHESLEKQGIQHVWYPSSGSHEWQVWRRHIYEFAQAVFKH